MKPTAIHVRTPAGLQVESMVHTFPMKCVGVRWGVECLGGGSLFTWSVPLLESFFRGTPVTAKGFHVSSRSLGTCFGRSARLKDGSPETQCLQTTQAGEVWKKKVEGNGTGAVLKFNPT